MGIVFLPCILVSCYQPLTRRSHFGMSSLASVKKQINGRVRIALHGTNGFTEDLLVKCIAAGVSKVNVNRLVLDDYYIHLRGGAPANLAHTALIEEGTDKVVQLTKRWMDICKSSGKAPSENRNST
jgi:fructose-bisphosphate aldolase, class II